MPAKSSFTRSVPPLHEIADIVQISQGDADKIKQYKFFLLSYLEDVRGTSDVHGFGVVSSRGGSKFSAGVREVHSCDVVGFHSYGVGTWMWFGKFSEERKEHSGERKEHS